MAFDITPYVDKTPAEVPGTLPRWSYDFRPQECAVVTHRQTL